MKYLWVSSVFMAGLIMSGGNALAESGDVLSGGTRNLPENQLLLADASVDLDITMEVVDEDVQSSKEITNVIELPLRSRYPEAEKAQEQLGNGPAFSNGPAEGQGHGPNPFTEGNQDSQQDTNRPDDSGRTDTTISDSGSRPDTIGPDSGNRPDATISDSGSRPDTVTGPDSGDRPETVTPGEMDKRDTAEKGTVDSGAKDAAPETQNKESNKKGN